MKTRKILITFFTVVVVVIFIAYIYANNSPYLIDAKEAKRRIQNKEFDVILDVRTKMERNTLGYYPGSVHIESASIEKEIKSKYPNKQTKILVYCNTGQRARNATEKLHKLGYTNTVYISGSHMSLF